MDKIVNDNVFGEMEYKHRWIKKENIRLMDTEYNLNIIAMAYTDENICDEQREAYEKFKGMIDKISKRMPSMIEEYVYDNKDSIMEYYPQVGNPRDAIKLIKPISVVFARDGKIVIMCEALWDEENGIGIEVSPEWKVDIQDSFL